MKNKIINNLKYIKFKDILAIFTYLLLFIPALIYKLYLKILNKKLYLICEDPNEACDNGYHLFKYIRTNYPNEFVYYAINKKSPQYKKIEKYGNVIDFYSIRHWIYYLSATKNVSTHKYGNPSPPLFYILHVVLNLYNNRVFLQHGITQNDSKWLYYKNTKFSTIICAAKPEYEYIKAKFGYPNDNVKYLGFPRFDNLNRNNINKKQIVIMPTWRNWLGRDTNALNKNEDFIDTEYYKRYNNLLNNKRLIDYIEKENIIVYFFPHRNMQKFINTFKPISKNVKIAYDKDIDIQKLLIESALLITDYSSVAMDFAYMKKPILYYQFDIEEFRKKQLQEGYFSYKDDGFGQVIINEEELVDQIINIIKNDYKLDIKYLHRIENFFEINDTNNCKRVFDEIRKI